MGKWILAATTMVTLGGLCAILVALVSYWPWAVVPIFFIAFTLGESA